MFHKVEFTNDIRLSYAVGRIRALENYMLSKVELERFVEMPDTQLEKVLDEHNYSINIGDSIQNNLITDYQHIIKFLKPIDEYKNIAKLLLMQNDIYNMKNYLKEKKFESDNLEKNYDLNFYRGNFSKEDIVDIIEKEKYDLIDKNKDFTAKYFKQIKNDFKSVWIEHYMDKLYSDLFFKELEKLNNNYLIFYYQNYLDLINIENIIRYKLLGKSIDEYKKIFFTNSMIRLIDIKDIYTIKIEEIPERFKIKPYYSVLKEGIALWTEKKNFNFFELKKDNFLLSILKISKIASFGIEPLLGYLWGRNIEYKNLRIVVEGRKRRLKQIKIKELLRDTYV